MKAGIIGLDTPRAVEFTKRPDRPPRQSRDKDVNMNESVYPEFPKTKKGQS